jgi:hypothetical protein
MDRRAHAHSRDAVLRQVSQPQVDGRSVGVVRDDLAVVVPPLKVLLVLLVDERRLGDSDEFAVLLLGCRTRRGDAKRLGAVPCELGEQLQLGRVVGG